MACVCKWCRYSEEPKGVFTCDTAQQYQYSILTPLEKDKFEDENDVGFFLIEAKQYD